MSGELILLETTRAAISLADALLEKAAVPRNSYEDALHIAIAASAGMDYLPTWNCKHIANAFMIPRVNSVIRGFGFEPPLICTPQQLMEE